MNLTYANTHQCFTKWLVVYKIDLIYSFSFGDCFVKWATIFAFVYPLDIYKRYLVYQYANLNQDIGFC